MVLENSSSSMSIIPCISLITCMSHIIKGTKKIVGRIQSGGEEKQNENQNQSVESSKIFVCILVFSSIISQMIPWDYSNI